MLALRFPNYRFYFAGQTISMIGTFAQQVALAWLVYRLTGSSVLLGVTAFLSQAPLLLIAPVAGVLIDRYDRRRFLMAVQWLALVQALVLAVLTYTERITPGIILVMSLLLGVINSFDAPARQALAARLVDDPKALPSAIALNSVIFNAGRFIGPSAAGLLLAATSEAVCFLVNGLTFFALLLCLTRVHLTQSPTRGGKPQGASAGSLAAGLRYTLSTPALVTLLALVSLYNLTVSSYIVVMPAVTALVFDGNPKMLGLLLGAAGFGSLFAAAFLANQRTVDRLPRIGAVNAVFSTVALIAFSFTHHALVAWVLLFLVGFGGTCTNVSANTLLQHLIADEYRGRVMSLYSASVFGMGAVGGLLIGVWADVWSAPTAIALQAAAFGLIAIVLLPKVVGIRTQRAAAETATS